MFFSLPKWKFQLSSFELLFQSFFPLHLYFILNYYRWSISTSSQIQSWFLNFFVVLPSTLTLTDISYWMSLMLCIIVVMATWSLYSHTSHQITFSITQISALIINSLYFTNQTFIFNHIPATQRHVLMWFLIVTVYACCKP